MGSLPAKLVPYSSVSPAVSTPGTIHHAIQVNFLSRHHLLCWPSPGRGGDRKGGGAHALHRLQLQEAGRIIRQCGYKDDSNLHRSGTCYYRSGYSTRTWTCSCEGNECNTASVPVTSSALLATAALALVARFAAA